MSSPLCIRVICQKTLLINDCYQTRINDSVRNNKKGRDSSVPVFVVALNGSRITPVEMPGHMPGPPEVVRDALLPWQLGDLLTATAALRGFRDRL